MAKFCVTSLIWLLPSLTNTSKINRKYIVLNVSRLSKFIHTCLHSTYQSQFIFAKNCVGYGGKLYKYHVCGITRRNKKCNHLYNHYSTLYPFTIYQTSFYSIFPQNQTRKFILLVPWSLILIFTIISQTP